MTADAATSAEKPATAQQRPHSRKGTLPEWEEENWRNANSGKILLARLTCRYRPLLWTIWWMLTGALGVLNDPWSRSWLGSRFHLSQRLLNTIDSTVDLLWLALFVLIVLLAGWFGAWFRYLAWRTAQACGAVVRLVRSQWRGLLVLLASLYLAWTGYRMADLSGFWGKNPGKLPAEFWQQVGAELLALVVLTLAALLWSSYRMHRRIVVQPFKDLTGLPDLPNGISEQLCSALAAIASLYRTINELQGERTDRVYGPAVDVRDVGDLLEGAVSADTSIDLKFLKLPLEFLLALGRRLLYKGRLSGSLHRQDGRLVLLASMNGSGPARNWKVEPHDLDAEDRDKPLPLLLDKMVQQLAFRIATDLVEAGSPKWRAVRHFTEGLRAYREAQRTDIQKFPRLRRAERSLLKALGEDQQFALCHYNLGVIYREMDEGLAAEAAFHRALQNNSEPSSACYAIAVGHYQAERYLDALWFTKNGIRRRPADPRAWHLKAASLYRQHRQGDGDGPVAKLADWQEILETEKIAVALAWWDLCAWLVKGPAQISELTASQHDRSEETSNSTLSLAIATVLWSLEAPDSRWKWLTKRRQRRRCAQAQRVFEQAARLSPSDATLYSGWGWVLLQQKDPNLLTAARVLDRVFAGGLSLPDRTDFWGRWLAVHAGLADSHPHDNHQHIAEEAYAYLLDFAGLPDWEVLKDLVEPLEDALAQIEQVVVSSEQEKKAKMEHSLGAAVRELKQSSNENPDLYAARLEKLARELEPEYLPAFYSWRLSGIIGLLKEMAKLRDPRELIRYGKTKKAEFAALQKDLDGLRLHLLEGRKDSPQFLLSLLRIIATKNGDWSWAYAQALASLAKHQIDGGGQQHERVRGMLAEAISLLQDGRVGHRQQIVEQLLDSQFAHACLLDADFAGRKGDAKGRTKLLKKGLEHAEKSVALRPEGDIEHCVLGQIYQELGDYERAKREWDLASFLEPDPEVLSMIGESLWRRAMEMSSRDSRQNALQQAIQFFENAQGIYESDPQSEHENLGEVHYWLGSFNRESLQYDKAIFHFKVAGSMGFRPLEARMSLAWTYLEAGLHAESRSLFEEVYKAAKREPGLLQESREERAAGPGEAMPIHEVVTRVYLGWALLYTDRGILLSRAEHLVRSAFPYMRSVRSYKRKELIARCFECLGWIYLQRQQLEGGAEADVKSASRYLRGALHLFARAEAYWLLAQVHLSRSALPSYQRTLELEKARDACERARTSDLRGRRLSDIEALLARIAAAEQPEPGPVSRPPAAHPSRLSFSPVATRRS